MKLLFISNLFPDTVEPYRGLDNATLLHHLAARWEIRVLAMRPTLSLRPQPRSARVADAVFAPRFIATRYVPKVGGRWNHRLLASALRAPLRELRAGFAFDIVLAAWLFPDACAVAELARELDFPFVAIAQGSDVHQYLRRPARRQVMTRLLPAAAAIITRSAELARLLGESGMSRERLRTIYNGVDLDCFARGDRAVARRELGFPIEGKSILFVGNFYPVKNPLLLVEAHARLIAEPEFQATRLVLLGAGPLKPQACRLVDRLGTAAHVIFTGQLAPASVARHLQAADVLCIPSQNEGVPNVLLEAFASGLPVVASRVGGIPEVHTADFLGRLIPAGDGDALVVGLKAVLEMPPAPERIRAHARQFSWDRTTDAYHEILRRGLE